jgi:hypothetical protein
MGKRRTFLRPFPMRHYRKLFVLATEGAETEPQYFALFNSKTTTVNVKCLKSSTDSAPVHVLKRMERHLQRNKLKSGDAAWLVVDKDQWTEEQLAQLHAWANKNEQYGLAVSNPGFELWMLLHFDDGAGIENLRQCKERLKRRLPNYDKGHIETSKLIPGIPDAIARARRKDTPSCTDWPHSIGTTVYRLVEKLLES